MFVFWRYKPMELERESPGRECLQTWCECQHRVADSGIRICCWNRGPDWLQLLQFSALPFLLAPFLLCLHGTTRGTPHQKPKHPQKREHEWWTPKERIAETRRKEESRHQLQNFQTSIKKRDGRKKDCNTNNWCRFNSMHTERERELRTSPILLLLLSLPPSFRNQPRRTLRRGRDAESEVFPSTKHSKQGQIARNKNRSGKILSMKSQCGGALCLQIDQKSQSRREKRKQIERGPSSALSLSLSPSTCKP